MTTISLSIRALETVVAGKFVSQYVVVDQEGNLVGSRAHKTEAEAKIEMGTLKYYAAGLEFARATAPEGATDKALVGKANIVAAYLMYKEALENPVAVETETSVEAETESQVQADAVSADEEF